MEEEEMRPRNATETGEGRSGPATIGGMSRDSSLSAPSLNTGANASGSEETFQTSKVSNETYSLKKTLRSHFNLANP